MVGNKQEFTKKIKYNKAQAQLFGNRDTETLKRIKSLTEVILVVNVFFLCKSSKRSQRRSTKSDKLFRREVLRSECSQRSCPMNHLTLSLVVHSWHSQVKK